MVAVIVKLKDGYKLWQEYLVHFPRQNRYTLGTRIDAVFLSAIEYCFLASYAGQDTKLNLLSRTISQVDLLKLLFQLAWEIRALDNKKYAHLGEHLTEIGRMLGGWKRGLLSKTPTRT